MDGAVSDLKLGNNRKEKQELESRSFKDGAIYLFRRADYKKPTWFCRVKVPNAKGYVSCSTKTTDEHQAFANDLFHKTLVSVANGKDLRSKKVAVALTEFVKHLTEAEKHRSTLHDKLLFLNRLQEFFIGKRLNEVNTKTLIELNEWLREKARNKTLLQHNCSA